MSSRQIRTQNESIPPLELPPGALAETDAKHEYDAEEDPPQVEPIEHRIRVDFMAGAPVKRTALLDSHNPWNAGPEDQDPWHGKRHSKPVAVKFAEATCERVWQDEHRFFDAFDSDAILDQAPAYLAHQLRQCRDQDNPKACVETERSNRRSWYRNLIPWKNLYEVCKKDNLGGLLPRVVGNDTVRDLNKFAGTIVVDDDVDPIAYAQEVGVGERWVGRESEVNSTVTDETPLPSDLGISLPAPLLVGEFNSGSRYAFLPWSDGLICSCPYKHGYPWRVTCKHELAAAIIAGLEDSIILPLDGGCQIPTRARRFVSPDIFCRHEPSLSWPQ